MIILSVPAGLLFLYGDGIKDDVYDNDYSAEDILFCYGHVFGVDYREQIPGDKVAAI